jgi:excinuclease UvrABC nuclease subunit
MSNQYTPVAPTVQIAHFPSMAYEERRDLPTIPALYFVVDSARNVVYIGQTVNLRDRWKSHHRAAQMERGGYRIHWRVVENDIQRRHYEARCIEHFRPPWNRSEVPVSDLKRVMAYISEVARYMEVDRDELLARILMDWAYNRKEV